MATFQNSSDYTETKVTAYKNGELVLDHSGAYVAQYYVSWQELSYDSQGKEVLPGSGGGQSMKRQPFLWFADEGSPSGESPSIFRLRTRWKMTRQSNHIVDLLRNKIKNSILD